MKLKEGIVTNSIDGESFAIATGKAARNFNGLIKNNPTSAFVFELLKTNHSFLLSRAPVTDRGREDGGRELTARLPFPRDRQGTFPYYFP